MDPTEQFHQPALPNAPFHGAKIPHAFKVRETELNALLIDCANRRQWPALESYVNQLNENAKLKPASLLRALNMPLVPGGMPLLAVMFVKEAPLASINRIIALGASPSCTFRIREASGRVSTRCSLMHLALLSGRPELLAVVPTRPGAFPVVNEQGESPLRMLARLGDVNWLARPAVQECAALAVRRFLNADGDAAELSRAVSMMIGRRAWQISEVVLDTWAVTEAKPEQLSIKGTDICKWAWYSVLENAPMSVIGSLHGLVHGGLLKPPLVFDNWTSHGLMAKYLPRKLALDPTAQHDWTPLSERLTKLDACRGIIPADQLSTVINTFVFGLEFPRKDRELELLGLSDHGRQLHPLTLFQAMLYGGAPIPMLKLALEMGADTTYRAQVAKDNGNFIDGAALHVAVCREDPKQIELLLKTGAPLSQLNFAGQTELHYLFERHNGELPLEKLPLVEVLIRAGARVEGSIDHVGGVLSERRLGKFKFGELMWLAQNIAEGKAAKDRLRSNSPEFEVAGVDGKLQKVSYAQLARLVEIEFTKRFQSFSLGTLGRMREHLSKLEMPLETIPLAMELAEKLAGAITNPLLREPSPAAPLDDRAVTSADSESLDDAPGGLAIEDEFPGIDGEMGEGEVGFLQIPEFGGIENGFTYVDPEPSDEGFGDDDPDSMTELVGFETESQEPEEETEVNDESEGATLESAQFLDAAAAPDPEKSVAGPIGPPLLELLDMSVDDIVSDDDFDDESVFALDDDFIDDAVFDSDEVVPLVIGAPGYLHRGHLVEAVQSSMRKGDFYEAYLLMKCLDEVHVKTPTELSALSRSLTSLLFRFNPKVANYIGRLVDGPYMDKDGLHPYLPELMCLLRNPLDKLRDPRSIGGLTYGITGISRLYMYGAVRGDLVDAWARIGVWNFSFPVWRFDSQPVSPVSGGLLHKSLMELAGMEKISDPVDEMWINPKTDKLEHLLGALFVVAKGTEFFDSVDPILAARLGYAPLDRETVVLFRRACIIISHPAHGTLAVRNSSQTFGRDRLPAPGLYRRGPMKKEELLKLTQQEIAGTFSSVIAQRLYTSRRHRAATSNGGPGLSTMTLDEGARAFNFLMEQGRTVRAWYARKKFDTHASTAWNQKTGELKGGYRSPLFAHTVNLLADRLAQADGPRQGKVVVPDLVVANPEFFPAPHARLKTSPEVVDILGRLAAGEEGKITEAEMTGSGIRDFLETAFRRGRDSELYLAAPDE